MNDVDFLVNRSGSGLDVANAAVNRAESVAIVEQGLLGGTCLNWECIPLTQVVHHADIHETIERSGEFFIDVDGTDIAFADIVREVNEAVADSGLVTLDDHDGHPSIRSLVEEGYEIITF